MGDRNSHGRHRALAVLGGGMVLISACTAPVDDRPDLPHGAGAATSVASPAATAAPSPPPTGPTTCDTEPRRAGPTVQEVLDDLVAGHAGGVAVAIGRDGEPVRLCAAGRADTSGTSTEPDDVFRIGSITKTFMAVLVLQLVDEEVLGLDDPVQRYVPDVPLTDAVTVRQLLNHSSGIPDIASLPELVDALLADPGRAWTPEETLAALAGLDRDFAPGSQLGYSSTNYIVAGLLVEQLTGRSLAENLRSRITGPLGLTATALAPDGPGPVTGFSQQLGPGGNTETVSLHALETAAWAAGGMVSTAEDLSVFFRALSAGDLLSAAALEEMTDVRGRAGVGLGVWRVQMPTGPGYGHGGEIPGYTAFAAVRPASGDVLVMLANEDALLPHQVERALFRAW